MGSIFNTAQEAEFMRQYTRDHLVASVPSYPVYVLDRDKTPYDALRGDFTGSRVFKDPVDVPLWIDPQPSEKLMERWGLNENRDIVANASIDTLESLGVDIIEGSVLIYNSETYDVKNVMRDQWYGSSDKPLILVLFLDLRRPSSTSSTPDVGPDEGSLPNTATGPVHRDDTVVDGTVERGPSPADESDIVIFEKD